MLERLILVRYGEIFLKSEFVAKMYEKKLVENIKRAFRLKNIKVKIKRERGRIFLKVWDLEESCEILKKIFGIVSFSPAFHLKTSKLERIKSFIEKNYEKWIKKNETFAVRVKRVGEHKYTSQELASVLGSVVKRKVDLKNPDKEIFVEVRGKDTYVYTEIIKGLGGLPVSTSGKVLSLISGGIDSPVAAWLMMKRGCKVVFVHFHSFPLVSKASIEKTKELVKVLNQFQFKSKVYFIPFHKIQTQVKTKIPAKYRIIIYRRFMLRISEEIAKKEGIKSLVTGEDLAQVSSQTLDNITTIAEATKLQVFRPLLGMDKVEIIDLAKKIGTYGISIKPQEDCCSLFVPKHPATKSDPKKIKTLEKNLEIKELVRDALKETEVITI